MPTVTPRRIDDIVASFCRALKPGVVPVYLNVDPSSQDEIDECFFNVQRRVDQYGGQIAYGWSVSTWEGVFIEAVHHGVWQQPDGSLTDVTPAIDKETCRLFLRDDDMTFDFESRRRRDNVRRPLVSDPLVAAFLSGAATIYEFMEKHSVGGTITIDREVLRPLAERQHGIQRAMYRKYLRINDRCPCGSGAKVKKCCGLEK